MTSILLIIAGIMAASFTVASAAIDLEGTVPADWSTGGGGSLAITPDHYRLGSQSLRWSWQSGSRLTASNQTIDPAKVLDFYYHTCDFWIYNETPADTLTVDFRDASNAVQFRFGIQLNFTGWRHIQRSFKYDMEVVGGGTNLSSVRFTAPATGTGQICLDDIEWVRARLTRNRDRVMPDVGGYSSSTLFYDLEQLTPDLAPDPATPSELAALPQIESEYWNSADGNAPSASAVTNAKNSFATWNIVRNGNLIKGAPVDRETVDEIDPFIGVLARAWHHNGDTQARDMAIDTIEHMIDQGWAGGSAESTDGGSDSYATREIITALLLLKDDYSPALRTKVEDLLQWRLKRGFFWDANLESRKDTDYIYTESIGLMGLALGFSDTDQEKVENLRGLKQYFDRFITVSSSTTGGIKPDGTGFHHWNHYNNYMYAFGQLAERIYLLRDTPFQVTQGSYETLRDACYLMALMCNDTDFATGFCGRKPLSPNLTVSATNFAKLAKAGGPFYGQSADPKIARFHNRVWGNDAALLGYGSEPVPAGFWQFNFSPAGLYRHGAAVVTMKGLTDTFWGTEIYADSNRYGRYQSYGSVEVMYPGGRAASGFDINGWDWNSPPGTTTIQLPFAELKAIEDRQDELADTRFCGALSTSLDPGGEFGVKGSFGIFGMKFQQRAISATHNPSFTFRKSVFASDGLLLCLGSDISNDDASHETTTNLFQVALPSTGTATNHLGTDVATFPLSESWSSGTHWFIDHLGTGYWLADGQDIHLERQSQTSPPQSGTGSDTAGNFAKAWISHGTAPSSGQYEYLVAPETTISGMQQIAADLAGPATPFTVVRKDASAHIVDLHRDGARAYVCFEANSAITHGPVMETSGPALLVTRADSGHLIVSYANPELALGFRDESPAAEVTTEVRLQGEWTVFAPHPQCQLVSSDAGSTLLRFATTDANPVEVDLLAPPGIIADGGDFSDQTGSLTGWFSSGVTPTDITHTTQSNDGSATTYDPANAEGPGDGIAGDGALLFDTANSVQGDEEIAYTFGGTMDLSESYTLDIACYNPGGIDHSYSVSLWNKTDAIQLTGSGIIGLTGGVIGCRETRLTYVPKLSDQGDQLEVRIRENIDNTQADLAVDSFSLTVGPAPSDTGLLQVADLRLPETSYPAAVTWFDPGFGPQTTRDVPSGNPVVVPCTFRGTSQNPGGTAPDSATDIGIRTYPSATHIVTLNRYATNSSGGRVGAVQWSLNLNQIASYLEASGKQLEILNLRLVTHPSDATKTYDVYLSYTSPADGISLTGISADASVNHSSLYWPSRGTTAGNLVGGTHKVLAIGQTGDLDLTTDLAPLFAAGVRDVNVILVSGDFLSSRTIEVRDGSGLSFQASNPSAASPFDSFMAGYPDLSGDDTLPGADPDRDGVSNLGEFIMGGSAPNNGSSLIRPIHGIVSGHLVVSLLAPNGATFAGTPSPSATVERVAVSVGGSLDLTFFDREVAETDNKPGLPAPPDGYKWHTFQLTTPVSSEGRGFLRIRFESP